MNEHTGASVKLTNYDLISNKIHNLQNLLQAAAPNYELLLREIHTNLAADADVVHLLSEEQIGVIVAGLSKKKGIVIAEVMTKVKKASLKNTGVDDL
jgi:hypothetical protein